MFLLPYVDLGQCSTTNCESTSIRAENPLAMTTHLWLSTLYFLINRPQTSLDTRVLRCIVSPPNMSRAVSGHDRKDHIAQTCRKKYFTWPLAPGCIEHNSWHLDKCSKAVSNQDWVLTHKPKRDELNSGMWWHLPHCPWKLFVAWDESLDMDRVLFRNHVPCTLGGGRMYQPSMNDQTIIFNTG